jgi:heme-degrading monooxygenase HmoA
MYVVVFRARMAKVDDEYIRTAASLRELAIGKYGCLDFVSVSEDGEELAISYWENEQQIRDWKNDPVHRQAQTRGRDKWYKSYSIDICELKRNYQSARPV